MGYKRRKKSYRQRQKAMLSYSYAKMFQDLHRTSLQPKEALTETRRRTILHGQTKRD